ncbi:MAG: hypothetical protein AAF710_01280 [Planctomycetota bacterium]
MLIGTGQARAEGFTGWQALRVIEQEGSPGRLYAADLDGDGRDEAIVVNLRHARLDVYASKAAPETGDKTSGGGGRANELPMAPEVERIEVAVRQPPIDVNVADLDGDGTKELYVLVSDPNRLLRLRRDDEGGAWRRDRAWDLLPGRYDGWDRLVRFVPDPRRDGGFVALVSMDSGFQQVRIDPAADDDTPSARPAWVPPREQRGRTDWWIGDLTGDGQDELIEWTNEDRLGVRVQPFGPASDENPSGLGPAETVHDERAQDVTWLPRTDSPGGASLLVLESRPAGVLRRYELSRGDAGPLGRRQPLALPGGADAVWAVGTIDGRPTLLAADPGQPRIALFRHGDAGWTAGPSFPVIADVKAIVETAGDSGRFLLWPDGGGDLFETRWDGKRLTYPRPIGLGGDAEDRQVLGLGVAGGTVWCVQKTGDDLTLHRWDGGVSLNTKLFAGVAGKAEAAKWIGGDSLLVADKFARSLRWVTFDDEGQPIGRQPPQLAGAKLDEFRLLGEGQALGRFTDGVFQRLDDGLQVTDQVMLPNGVSLIDLGPGPAGELCALAADGRAIYRLQPDEAGVPRVVSMSRVPSGRGLSYDERVGLLLRTDTGLTRLDAGRPDELEVAQNLDPDDGQPAGSGEASVNRLAATDLDGDGRVDALLFDDVRHQITAVGFGDTASPTDTDADLRPMLSWPVFEDRAYPYGGGGENEAVREPRRVVALDLDGDGGQDLALLSHDRLLIYLAREPQR